MITCTRYHDFSAGHRVRLHESKCRNLHGHNYRVHFTCSAEEKDHIGRVVDFGFMKSELCQWLEENWDHKFLVHHRDSVAGYLEQLDLGVIRVPWNPTAENMAQFLLNKKWNLPDGVELVRVVVEETRKCSAEASK